MDGFTWEICKGVCGIPIADKLANDLLKERLSTAGYDPVQFTHGLWNHACRLTTFTLVVDNFGIKFLGDIHANHLVETLKKIKVLEDIHANHLVETLKKWYVVTKIWK